MLPTLNNIQSQLLFDSYQRLLNQPLLVLKPNQPLSEQLFEADFVLLAHDTGADPLFNYGNRRALDLFELSWDELLAMPSRLSAEPVNQQQREALLQQVKSQGFIDHYSGVRISKTGRRFRIDNAVVWNIFDQDGQYHGQAACFSDWIFVS